MEFYQNTLNFGQYQYARSYTTNLSKNLKFTEDGGQTQIDINITGIPDGVSPIANEAIIQNNQPKRLYVFSDKPLDQTILDKIDNLYGKETYPIITSVVTCGRKLFPRKNFYICDGSPSVISNFTEYRYAQQRHMQSSCCVDVNNGNIYRLALPHKVLLVIIMPDNFIQTGKRSGYFHFENNLIIQVISKYQLTSTSFNQNELPSSSIPDIVPYKEISQISTFDDRLSTTIKQFFIRMDMHKIITERQNQIYAYDAYMTLVAGFVDNISFAI